MFSGIAARRCAALRRPLVTLARVPATTRALSTATPSITPADAEAGADSFTVSRMAFLARLQEAGIPAFPHYRRPADALALRAVVEHVRTHQTPPASKEDDPLLGSLQASVAGRVEGIRQSGRNLVFVDLAADGHQLQVVANRRQFAAPDPASPGLDPFTDLVQNLTRGDVVEFAGHTRFSQSGEPSLYATQARLLAPCTLPLPAPGPVRSSRAAGARHLELILDTTARERFRIRSRVIATLRRFLEDLDFLEVETPVLSAIPGGASARPFQTTSNALGRDLSMRISPELYLKRLVIGGFERVFEIGKQFRNEGIDHDHNPEFTTCELYQAYANCEDMMDLTENLFREIIRKINGDSLVLTVENKQGLLVEVDFAPPFQRMSIPHELEILLGAPVPDLSTDVELEFFVERVIDRLGPGALPPAPLTAARVVDHLVSEYLEPRCDQPTFLTGHPAALSPLAKAHPALAHASDRFELFVAQRELVNAYSEQNDPNAQYQSFHQQAASRLAGDDEAHVPDHDYCQAMRYGLPPTGGWGLGVDRLVMMLTGSAHIRDIILFPATKSASASVSVPDES
ncbi:lysyl-tRNA synthetase [Fonticula alba]|uniref:Lysine--tRNA ligase n=1 Tax=Fonticula alba TaxID=691883 RepID=A0A058ZAC9_FONAL|nr:lysyl-tRNA synthetase [Fonticula alba]KCV71245.1 lysyl-tRNA synthetase [Fonticula alba]|eukprot:XP_009494368.1 lysyl-tRNA synthetase [Fonticula alba]